MVSNSGRRVFTLGGLAWSVCLLAVVVVIPGLVRAEATASGRSQCVQLLVSRCEQCHYVTRACQKLGKKSKWKWKRTIKNMVRHGAKLTKAEQKALVNCLAAKEESVVEYCANPLPPDKPRIKEHGSALSRQQ